MLEIEQERERERAQHRLALEKTQNALKEALAANSSAQAVESRNEHSAKDQEVELELKKLR